MLAGSIPYDGDCGLCHGFVRFVLAEDGEFRFAALTADTGTIRVENASGEFSSPSSACSSSASAGASARWNT